MIHPLFAAYRIDTWVMIVSVAIPVAALVAIVLWQLYGRLSAKRPRARRAVRESPEPARPQLEDDPERLERACAALAESLGERYQELANCWMRQGQPAKAATVLKQILQSCPHTRQAEIASDRLRELNAIEPHS